MSGAEWVMRVVLPSWGIMALGGGLWALGGYGLRWRAPEPWWRAAAAAGVFVLLMGMVYASSHMHLEMASILIIEFGAFGLALWKGSWTERFVATQQLLLTLSTGVAGALGWLPYGHLPEAAWRSVIVTTAQLALMLYVAVRATRYWVIWAASIQMLAVILALLALFGGGIGYWAWATVNDFWCYVFDATVLYGIAQHWWEAEVAPQMARPVRRAKAWRLILQPELAAEAAR